MKQVTLTLTAEQHEALIKHLFPGDGKEAIAFVLCTRRDGDRRHRLLGSEVFLLPHEDCTERSHDRVCWNTDAIVSLLEKAEERKLSLLKIHSHPTGQRTFSRLDDEADALLFPAVHGWAGHDFLHASAIMLPDGEIIARYYSRENTGAVARVMIVGNDIRIWHASQNIKQTQLSFAASHAQLFGERTIDEFSRLSIGVIGASGTGGPIIEQLVRLGVGEIVLVDPDIMKDRNINRIPNSTMKDVAEKRFKVHTLADRVEQIGLGTIVHPLAKNIWCAKSVTDVAQCDLLVGCMDSIDGRFLLNLLSTYYLLPYFDIGVRLVAIPGGVRAGEIQEVCGTVHYLQPGKSSLISRGLVNMQQVSADRLLQNDPAAHAQQVKDGYITGVQENRPAVISVGLRGIVWVNLPDLPSRLVA